MTAYNRRFLPYASLHRHHFADTIVGEGVNPQCSAIYFGSYRVHRGRSKLIRDRAERFKNLLLIMKVLQRRFEVGLSNAWDFSGYAPCGFGHVGIPALSIIPLLIGRGLQRISFRKKMNTGRDISNCIRGFPLSSHPLQGTGLLAKFWHMLITANCICYEAIVSFLT